MIDYMPLWLKAVELEGQVDDPWQERVMKHEGNFVLRTGRQVGKSRTVAKKSSKLAIQYPGTETLIIAASQRQSSHIFEKIIHKFNIIDHAWGCIKSYLCYKL